MKIVQIRIFSGPYFPAFGLNTERYSVFSPNAGKYGPVKTPYLDTFHAVHDITVRFCGEEKMESKFICSTHYFQKKMTGGLFVYRKNKYWGVIIYRSIMTGKLFFRGVKI